MEQLFRVICADPPWDFPPTGSKLRPKAFGGFVPSLRKSWFSEGKVLSEAQLCSAKIPKMDISCLFLWCTASNMPMALRVMNSWGFQYKTCFVWVKTCSSDNTKIKTQIFGYWSSVQHELLLFGVCGKFGTIKGDCKPGGNMKSVFMLPHPGGIAAKPPEVYDEIARHYPEPRLELFASIRRHGWACQGHGVENPDVIIPEWENGTLHPPQAERVSEIVGSTVERTTNEGVMHKAYSYTDKQGKIIQVRAHIEHPHGRK